MYKQRVLVLGGSTEGFLLAERINAKYGDSMETVTSFAGVTRRRRAVAGRSRVGGFGGVDGLAAWLRKEAISCVIDATHPFATQIKRNAGLAVRRVTGVGLLHILRPAWQPAEGDRWISVRDMERAARHCRDLTGGQGIFLAVGRTELATFRGCPHLRFIARVIDPPGQAVLPENIRLVIDRGPFCLEAERSLFREHTIDCVVCKNSGGSAARAKLEVARERGIPVVMVQRPSTPAAEVVPDVGGAMDWLERRKPAPT